MRSFDYSKLKGRIVEKCGTMQHFADEMGWSMSTNGKKLSNKVAWAQDEILQACAILDIAREEITVYFFTLEC